MTKEFKVGDVVELRSGDGSMVVEGINQDSVTCLWRNKSGNIKKQEFHAALLKESIEGLILSMGENVVPKKDLQEDIYSDWEGFIQNLPGSAEDETKK